MRNKWIYLMLCCALMACKNNSVDFTYTPTSPRAGMWVQFINRSTRGTDWYWTFGDSTATSTQSPSHRFRKPGKYTVRLVVDNRESWSCTKIVTVLDTAAQLYCSVDSVEAKGIPMFTDVVFTADVYNPYNKKVQYQWSIASMDQTCFKVLNDTMTNDKLKIYFTRPMEKVSVVVRVTMDDKTEVVSRDYQVMDKPLPALLVQALDSCYRIRMSGERYEPQAALSASQRDSLNNYQDTAQIYNGRTYRCGDLPLPSGVTTRHFRINQGKIYYISEQDRYLYIMNLNGSNNTRIVTQGTMDAHMRAICVDPIHQRLYVATDAGIHSLPFILSDNNAYGDEWPFERISDEDDAVKLAFDKRLQYYK